MWSTRKDYLNLPQNLASSVKLSLRISNLTHLHALHLSPWPHFMKPCSSHQYQTCPLPALTAIFPAFLWWQAKKSSSSSCRPSSSSHIFLVPLPWKPSGKVFLCRWLSFFFSSSKSLSDLLISGSHSHQASKMSLSMSLVTLPNPRASFLPPPYLSAAWPLYAPNTVFLDLLNLLIALSPLPLPPLYWLFSTWLQDDSFLGLHPKSSAFSTHFCEQLVHRDDFR